MIRSLSLWADRPRGFEHTARRSRGLPWPHIAPAALGAALIAVYWLEPLIRDELLVAAALGAAVAVAIGIVVHSAHERGWWAVAVGLALFAAGHAVEALPASSLVAAPAPSAAIVPYFAGEVAMVIGVGSLAGATNGRYYRPALLDAMLVAIAFGYAAWVALSGPLIDRPDDQLKGAIAIAVPIVDMILVGVLAHNLLQPGGATRAMVLLAAGVLSWLVADTAYAATAIGTYARGNPVDAGWLVGYLLIAAGGLNQSVAPARPRKIDEAALSDRRLVLIASTLALTIVLFVVQGPPADAVHYGAFVLSGASVALVGSARLLGSIRASRILLASERALQIELDRRARTDHLTGLLNREELIELLCATLAGPGPIGLLLLDLDDFKRINDAFGHQTGDALLRQAAGRIRSTVRLGDHVARIGGDEFVILLAECHSPADAIDVAQRILAAFQLEIRLEQHATRIRPSIGIAWSHAEELTADDILSRADIAMYRSKELRTGYQLFAASMHDAAIARARLRSDLDGAVGRGEIVPWYQPIVDVATGRLLGVEALARWRHPERGLLQPGEFIALAEAAGRIGEIDRSVLLAGCVDVAGWCRTHGLDLQVHVNFSPLEIADPATVLTIAAALDATGLPPSRLVVEVTETALLEESAVENTLDGLRELGVRLAIDDFGSRYAVLAQLGRLAIDIVKLDRSLVVGVTTPHGARLLGGILRLTDSLGLETVAEGVESTTMLTLLRKLGCTAAQGYGLGRPAPAEEIESRLSNLLDVPELRV